MPSKVFKRIIDEYKQDDSNEKNLSLVDQSISNILDIPEICN
jgi:hypothetical protein